MKFTSKIYYQFGTIYRQVAKRDIKLCNIFKNGVHQPPDIVAKIIYAAIGHSLPDIVKQGCPYKKGFYNFTNITVALTELPFNQLIASGNYKLVLNLTVDKALFAHGFGVVEIKTPLTFWS